MIALLGATLALLLAGASPAAETRWVMGTRLVIEIEHRDDPIAERARHQAFEEAQRLDNLLSNYLPYSPLSQLNQHAGEGPFPVEFELANYLLRARQDSRRTDGAFDVTVGALVQAHRAGADAAGIAAALATVGADRIEFENVPATDPPVTTRGVSLPVGMAIDPGGDGKGVAVDAMVASLRANRMAAALVDFGGSSFFGLGSSADGDWKVALRGPEDELLGFVRLRDLAMSTSSALPPVTAEDGTPAPRRGHVIDPRTGALVNVPRTAVVLSPSATDAEVLSTALIVEGRAGTRWLPRFPDAEAAVFEPGADPWMTPGFAERFEAVAAPSSGQ